MLFKGNKKKCKPDDNMMSGLGLGNPWCDSIVQPKNGRTGGKRRRRTLHNHAKPLENDDAGSDSILTVRDERKLLQEIRSTINITSHTRLRSFDIRAGEFALRYILGHHLKRKIVKFSRRPEPEPPLADVP